MKAFILKQISKVVFYPFAIYQENTDNEGDKKLRLWINGVYRWKTIIIFDILDIGNSENGIGTNLFDFFP